MELREVDRKIPNMRPNTRPLVGNQGVESGHHLGACAKRQDIWREMPPQRLVIHLPHGALEGRPRLDRQFVAKPPQ